MLFVIIGLGNPGEAYSASRHNVGFAAVARLAARNGIGWWPEPGLKALVGRGELGGRSVLLLQPQTFMNLSGRALVAAGRRWPFEPDHLLVLHDDIDLEPGRLQLRRGGGDGGHRGLRSLIEELGSTDFARVRIGIGRPPATTAAADYVLTGFESQAQLSVERWIDLASWAAEAWLVAGLERTSNRFNPWKK